MKLVWHIIKKDFRHLWPWLVLWYVSFVQLIYPDFGLWKILSGQFTGGDNVSLVYISFVLALSTLAYAVPLILVASLVDADPPLDDRALWRTQPLGGARLFAAKIFFLFAFGVLVPALMVAPGQRPPFAEVMMVKGGMTVTATPGQWVPAASAHKVEGGTTAMTAPVVWLPDVPPSGLSLFACWMVLLAADAILLFLVASFFRKPLVGFAVLGVFLLLLTVTVPIIATSFLLYLFTWASATVALLAGLAAVACIYIQHRRGVALIVLLVGLALAIVVGCLWPSLLS